MRQGKSITSCCHCNRCSSGCRSNKKEKAPKPALKGWRRCFFKKKKEEPVLPMIMQDTDTYQPMYSMEANAPVYEDPDKADNQEKSEPQIKFNIPFRPMIL